MSIGPRNDTITLFGDSTFFGSLGKTVNVTVEATDGDTPYTATFDSDDMQSTIPVDSIVNAGKCTVGVPSGTTVTSFTITIEATGEAGSLTGTLEFAFSPAAANQVVQLICVNDTFFALFSEPFEQVNTPMGLLWKVSTALSPASSS